MDKEIATKAGLIPCGQNEDGEQEYIGSRQDWDKADELQELKDSQS